MSTRCPANTARKGPTAEAAAGGGTVGASIGVELLERVSRVDVALGQPPTMGKVRAPDALRGDKLFLIRYLSKGGYQVRLLDLATGKLRPKPLKDPHESGTIWGQPFSRLSSSRISCWSTSIGRRPAGKFARSRAWSSSKTVAYCAAACSNTTSGTKGQGSGAIVHRPSSVPDP